MRYLGLEAASSGVESVVTRGILWIVVLALGAKFLTIGRTSAHWRLVGSDRQLLGRLFRVRILLTCRCCQLQNSLSRSPALPNGNLATLFCPWVLAALQDWSGLPVPGPRMHRSHRLACEVGTTHGATVRYQARRHVQPIGSGGYLELT